MPFKKVLAHIHLYFTVVYCIVVILSSYTFLHVLAIFDIMSLPFIPMCYLLYQVMPKAMLMIWRFLFSPNYLASAYISTSYVLHIRSCSTCVCIQSCCCHGIGYKENTITLCSNIGCCIIACYKVKCLLACYLCLCVSVCIHPAHGLNFYLTAKVSIDFPSLFTIPLGTCREG